MISSLCEAYHWTYEEAMRRTLPQIIMLNHAAWVNHERMEYELERQERTGENKQRKARRKVPDNPDGINDMTTDQFMMYWSSVNANETIPKE